MSAERRCRRCTRSFFSSSLPAAEHVFVVGALRFFLWPWRRGQSLLGGHVVVGRFTARFRDIAVRPTCGRYGPLLASASSAIAARYQSFATFAAGVGVTGSSRIFFDGSAGQDRRASLIGRGLQFAVGRWLAHGHQGITAHGRAHIRGSLRPQERWQHRTWHHASFGPMVARVDRFVAAPFICHGSHLDFVATPAPRAHTSHSTSPLHAVQPRPAPSCTPSHVPQDFGREAGQVLYSAVKADRDGQYVGA